MRSTDIADLQQCLGAVIYSIVIKHKPCICIIFEIRNLTISCLLASQAQLPSQGSHPPILCPCAEAKLQEKGLDVLPSAMVLSCLIMWGIVLVTDAQDQFPGSG